MFFARLASTIVLLGLFFCAFALHGLAGVLVFVALGAYLSVTVVVELDAILRKLGLSSFSPSTEIVAAAMFVLPMASGAGREYLSDLSLGLGGNAAIALLVIGAFSAYCLLKLLLSNNNPEVLKAAVVSMGIIGFYIVPLNFLAQIYLIGHGASDIGVMLVLFMILVTKSGDVGAYVVGTLSSKRPGGNHKMFPKISPKKSWEGAFGGMLLSVICALAIIKTTDLSQRFGLLHAVLFGVLLFVGGFVGDLCESAMKRAGGVKDSGKSIPGIGGALDLVDSLVLNAPLFYLTLTLVRLT